MVQGSRNSVGNRYCHICELTSDLPPEGCVLNSKKSLSFCMKTNVCSLIYFKVDLSWQQGSNIPNIGSLESLK